MLIPPIYRFELEIDMTKTEIKEMLTKYTANSMVFGERLEEYYFFSGYIDEGKFRFYPMPRKVPYYGKKNSFIPKVTGIIHSITLTKSVIKVTISGTWIYAFIFLVWTIDFKNINLGWISIPIIGFVLGLIHIIFIYKGSLICKTITMVSILLYVFILPFIIAFIN